MDIEEIKNIESWIKEYIENARAKGVVLGISGGKDSLVTAKLCANAIGKESVLGIILPNGNMKDVDIAIEVCNTIGIRYYKVDISNSVNSILDNVSEVFEKENANISTVTTFNIPPRIRMSTLYAIAGSLNYLVANTSNLSEATVGYTTKWGDNIGDISPLANYTKSEVCEIGTLLNLPKHLVYKAPDDGLTGKTDEENLGVSYDEIDSYIRTGSSNNEERILHLNKVSSHKRIGTAKFENNRKNYLDNK